MKWFLAAVFAADLVAAAYLVHRRRLAKACQQRAWDAEELAHKEECEKMDQENLELRRKLADGRHHLVVEWLETIDAKLDTALKCLKDRDVSAAM